MRGDNLTNHTRSFKFLPLTRSEPVSPEWEGLSKCANCFKSSSLVIYYISFDCFLCTPIGILCVKRWKYFKLQLRKVNIFAWISLPIRIRKISQSSQPKTNTNLMGVLNDQIYHDFLLTEDSSAIIRITHRFNPLLFIILDLLSTKR